MQASSRSGRPSARRRRSPPERASGDGRRVLLTGATGLLGSRILPQLLQRGWQVVAVGLSRHNPDAVPGVIRLTADLRESGWQQWCAGCSAVLHLAGILEESPRAGDTFVSAHLQMTRNIVAACSQFGMHRLVMLSALGAPESSTAFHRSKLLAEEVLHPSELRWTVVRIPPLFGPGDHWSATLARALGRLPFFPVVGDGGTALQLMAVEDVVPILLDTLEQPVIAGDTFEIGGPEVLPYREVVRRTAAATGTRFRPVFLSPSMARWLLPMAARLARTPLTQGPLGLLHSRAVVSSGRPANPGQAELRRYEGPTWLAGGG